MGASTCCYAAHKGIFDLAATEDREVPVVVTDFATAELVKVAANAFLATKISFINAMAEVCEAAGADVTQLARSIGYDARIGNKFLRAGIGFGGGCLPKDIRAFQARAQELGVGEALRFLHEVDLINQRRRNRVVKLAAELLGRASGPAGPDLAGARIAVLGATFKPNSDDVRDSPALAVARKLARAGAEVTVYDPEGMANAERELPDVTYAKTLTDAVTGADLVCVLTEWDEFRNADPARWATWSPASASSTAGTAWTGRSGSGPAGRTAAWAARSPRPTDRAGAPPPPRNHDRPGRASARPGWSFASTPGRPLVSGAGEPASFMENQTIGAGGARRQEHTAPVRLAGKAAHALVRYPCTNCGEQADSVSGCPSCGRTPPQELAALELDITSMQANYRKATEQRTLLFKRISAALTRYTLLKEEIAQAARRGVFQRTTKGGQPGPAANAVPRHPGSYAKGDAGDSQQSGAPAGSNARAGTVPPIQRPAPADDGAAEQTTGAAAGPTKSAGGTRHGTARTGSPRRGAARAGSPRRGKPAPPHGHGPETSSKSTQNYLLVLGALLLAVSSFVLTGYLLPVIGAGGRALIFLLLTVAALAAPRQIAKQGLISTAETVATVGLIFVLVDGYNVWSAGWLRGTGLTAAAYAGLVCLAAAGIAAAYRTIIHLFAPKFAAVLLVQPVMPLLGFSIIHGISAWATVFAAVAAANLALALVLNGLRGHGPGLVAWALAGPRQPVLTRQTPYLVDAVWALHGLGVLVGVACAVVALGRADDTTSALGGAAALLIAAVVGMGGALLLRRPPLPDVGVALATLAVIGAVGRVAAVVAPGRGLLTAALAVLGAAVALRLLGITAPVPGGPAGALTPGGPAGAAEAAYSGRAGARWACLAGSVAVGVLVLLAGLNSIITPVRASLPAWHGDLSRYPARVAESAGNHGASLCLAALVLAAAAVLFAPRDRGDAVTACLGLAVLLAPAGFGLPWAFAPLFGTLAALVAGGYALAAKHPRSAAVRAGTALVVGGFAAATALAHPGPAALTLLVIAIGGAVIGSAPRLSRFTGDDRDTIVDPQIDRARALRQVELIRANAIAGDLALGGAAFALPGAVASAIAALAPLVVGAGPILAATYLAVAGTLCATALAQVAAERERAAGGHQVETSTGWLVPLGATLGAAVLAIVTLRTPTGTLDRGVALLLLLAGSIVLFSRWLFGDRLAAAAAAEPPADGDPVPPLSPGDRQPRSGGVLGALSASDISAIVVTTAAIAAVTRVGALIVPRYALASAAVVVLAVAIGIRGIPANWRRGPVIGAAVVATLVGLIAGVTAVRAGIEVIKATRPLWHTDLTNWYAHISDGYAGQVPATLLLLAAAAAIGLPRPWSQEGVAAGVGLAVLAAPACLGLAWWTPIGLSGLAATVFGIAAATTRDARAAWVRFGVAAVLFADTVAASLVSPSTTTATLFGAAAINAAVAGTAMVTRRRIAVVKVPPQHLLLIGGGALAAAVLTVPAAFGCLAASRGAGTATVLTAALAGLCIAFAAAATACSDDAAMMLYTTIAVATGGTVIAIGTLRDGHLPVEVYAAAATLLVVLSELLRSAVLAKQEWRVATRPRAGDRAATATGRRPPRPGYTVLVAAGPATVLAVAWLAPRILAALFGPYQQLNDVWPDQPPVTAADGLGDLAGWAGDGNAVVAALLLTIAAALGTVGFGGTDRQIVERAVAVVIPCAAITLLIAPAALGLPWAAQPLAALLVAALCGLGVALTRAPARLSSPLRDPRRIVVLTCVLAGAAGLAGALGTQGMTMVSLAVTAGCGLLAGLRGRDATARIVGWLVTGAGGLLLALVIGRVALLPVYQSAFLVGAVAAGLLVLAAVVPRLRRRSASAESMTVEATAYAGALFALLLASRSQPYLATFCLCWGVVLGVAARRPGRSVLYRRALIWFAVGHEVIAWWLFAHLGGVHAVEGYSLAVAAGALVIGWLETRRRPDLSSWSAYGFALVAAFLPSLAVLISGDADPWRRALLILGSAATVALGATRRQQAPLVIGGVALVIAALYELAVFSTAALLGAVLAITAVVLVGLGASTEQRRRRAEALRGAWGKLR